MNYAHCDVYYHQGKYHCENECKVFTASRISSNSIGDLAQKYYIIGAIRTLQLKEKNPSQWALIQDLYVERHDKKEAEKESDDALITFIRKNCNLERFNEIEIKIVLEILKFQSWNTSDYDSTSLRWSYTHY
ncbi:unnamed protein product [Orchesella dallaii]|uniref:Uncharacterized protein n=1 Tax=Orchesella dallaii TaxID=48710 RepID=A0ABP1RTR1_9HEXA